MHFAFDTFDGAEIWIGVPAERLRQQGKLVNSYKLPVWTGHAWESLGKVKEWRTDGKPMQPGKDYVFFFAATRWDGDAPTFVMVPQGGFYARAGTSPTVRLR